MSIDVGNKSVPMQLAQCWYTGLAILSSAKVEMYFWNKICGNSFIKQHLETVVLKLAKKLIAVLKK